MKNPYESVSLPVDEGVAYASKMQRDLNKKIGESDAEGRRLSAKKINIAYVAARNGNLESLKDLHKKWIPNPDETKIDLHV